MIQAQEERITELEETVETLEDQVDQESQDLQEATSRLDEAARQLREGKLSGEAGAELLTKLNNYSARSKTEARAKTIYYQIIERGKVGDKIPTSQITDWRSPDTGELYFETSNPNQTVHRAMGKLEELTEESHLLGEVQVYIYRGEKVVELVAEDGS